MQPRLLIVLLAALSMLGALSIDTYLPALPAIAHEFSISAAAGQQTLSVFLFAFSFMTLFYGTLSDSFGRRPVVLYSLLLFLAASIGATWSPSFGWLIFFRLMQGLSAGAGGVVGRAVIGDLYKGAEAQRMMAFISMVFGLAPAIAPILGGWMQSAFGWRSIFLLIVLFTLATLVACLRFLPESLEPEQRHPFDAKLIVANYWRTGGHPRFVLKCLGNAFSFSGVALYIGSASAFIYSILHLTARDFGWLFIPLIGGMTVGSMLSARVSHRMCPRTIIRLGYALMVVAAAANVLYTATCVASVPWAVIAPFFYCLGMQFAAPAMSVEMMDMFPHARGLVSSLMSFTFLIVFAVLSGTVCPFLFDSAFHLALGVMVGVVISIIFWALGTTKDEGAAPTDQAPTPDEVPLEI